MTTDDRDYLICWALVGGLFGAAICSKKGINALAGFLAGALVGPCLVWLFLLVSDNKKGLGLKECPYCAEWVKKQATVCKFCQKGLVPVP